MADLFDVIGFAFRINVIAFCGVAPYNLVDYTNVVVLNVILYCV
jgi:hypothetical protein